MSLSKITIFRSSQKLNCVKSILLFSFVKQRSIQTVSNCTCFKSTRLSRLRRDVERRLFFTGLFPVLVAWDLGGRPAVQVYCIGWHSITD